MKIICNYPREEYDTIEQAVKSCLEPDAYSYDGQLEGLKAHINKQKEFIVKLTDILTRKLNFTANEIEELLGYGYSVKD